LNLNLVHLFTRLMQRKNQK